jgi:hypothetical protein
LDLCLGLSGALRGDNLELEVVGGSLMKKEIFVDGDSLMSIVVMWLFFKCYYLTLRIVSSNILIIPCDYN